MTLLLTLAIVGAAVIATPILTRALGRESGWPLAAAYLAAAAVLTPAAIDAVAGSPQTWSVPWIPIINVDFALRLDALGVVFSYIALIIGAVVFAYSTRYLERGRQLSFYLVMTAFTFSMLMLVMADDLILVFIAWELTSLASFFLIARSGQYGEAASMRTLLLTFIGGLAFLAAVGLIAARTHTTDLSAVFGNTIWTSDPAFTTTVAMLVALAAFTKSAQFPFHVWLPDAMAAITPVSAYLHAAAVVKAGIFLLMRFSPLFAHNLAWNTTLIVVGLFTSLIGAWFALTQTNFKKLMAYSTVSQLGLIVATIGIGTEPALAAAILHTIAHAMFKSGLFMVVGVVDHATGTRELTRMPPKLYKAMPLTFGITVLGAASMAGIPPMLGFISKEEILAAASFAPGAPWAGGATLAVISLGAVLTLSYCVKIVFAAFIDGTDSDHEPHHLDLTLTLSAGLPIIASTILAFVVHLLNEPISAATTTATGHHGHVHLSLWHGFTLELAISVTIILIGAVIVWKRHAIFGFIEDNPFPFQGEEVIAIIGTGLRKLGLAVDGFFTAPIATRHVIAILSSLSAIAIPGVFLLIGAGLPAQIPGMSEPIDIIVMVLMIGAVLGVVLSQSRIGATVSLSAVGILATVQILALGAPDVALTQLLVETLSIIVIMLVLQKLPREFLKPSKQHRPAMVTISLLAGASVAGLAWALNGRRPRSSIAEYFLTKTHEIAEGHNPVNVILVEFRALDTLGELSVLGMAGIAIIAVLSTVRNRHLDPTNPEDRLIATPDLQLNPDPLSSAHRAMTVAWPNVIGLQLMLRLVSPMLLVISFVLFMRGHNAPGGGFIAALVAAAAIGLTYLSTSKDRALGPPRAPVILVGAGIATAALTGILGMVAGGSFLKPFHGHLGSEHVTTSMIFDFGVFLSVVGLMLIAFNLLGVTPESASTGEGTRERADETVEGELEGPLDTVRGERAQRVSVTTNFVSLGQAPREVGR